MDGAPLGLVFLPARHFRQYPFSYYLTRDVVILFSAEEGWLGIRTRSVRVHRLHAIAECVSDLSYS
jgi:hypothetical protein